MESNNDLRLQATSFPNGNDTSDFQTEISVEIIKLVRKHLTDAQIEGLITETIRDRLLHRYITELTQLEQGIKQKALQSRLQKLEKMQEQLVQAYHENLSQLQTEIQQFRGVSPPNKAPIFQTDSSLPQRPTTVSEFKQAQLPRPQMKAKPSRHNRFNAIQRISFPSIGKYLLSAIVIGALTLIGIRYGMTMFMAAGSLLIGGTLFIRFVKR